MHILIFISMVLLGLFISYPLTVRVLVNKYNYSVIDNTRDKIRLIINKGLPLFLMIYLFVSLFLLFIPEIIKYDIIPEKSDFGFMHVVYIIDLIVSAILAGFTLKFLMSKIKYFEDKMNDKLTFVVVSLFPGLYIVLLYYSIFGIIIRIIYFNITGNKLYL